MRNFILFLAFSAAAFGQCGANGKLIKNPLTGLWDCTGSSSGGGTPGGSTTQCQYNNSGAFGGISGCTTDGTTVTLASPIVTGTLTVGTSLSVDGSTGIATTSKIGNAALSLLTGAGKWLNGVPVGQASCSDLADASTTCATAGANRALSNLASVSINAVLGFQTGIAVGNTTNPAKNIVFNASGTYGTGSYTYAGTPTANRTITLADADMTMLYSGGPGGTPSSLTLTNALSLPASGIGSGTIATARLGSGSATSSTYLRGDQTWAASATIASTSSVVKGDGAGNIVAATAGTDFVGGMASIGVVTSSIPRATAGGLLADSFMTCTGTPMTCTFYDSTASTGSTKVVVRNGAGQSTDKPFQIFDNNGSTNLFFVSSVGAATLVGNFTAAQGIFSSNVTTGSTTKFLWSTKSEMASGADGRINLLNANENGFTRLTLGPESASFPAWLVTTQTNPIMACVDGTGANTCQIKANAYLSSDGTAGVTVTTCTGFKNGLCISGS